MITILVCMSLFIWDRLLEVGVVTDLKSTWLHMVVIIPTRSWTKEFGHSAFDKEY